jgi:hypothetical protein
MAEKALGKQIVVIDNGFVHVGDVFIEDGLVRIENCRNIRVWGTSKGLGELAGGPTKKTEHDFAGTVLVPVGRVVFYLGVTRGW